MPRLLSVNVSRPKEIEVKGKTVRTGIFKEPVAGKVKVRHLNLEGDGQADLLAHGGEQRAVYVYSHDNYSFWSDELGRDSFPFGQFGENFTVEGMLDDQVHVGDRFKIGTALFEVTQPRVPCYKLAIKMQSDNFFSRILDSGRLGFYFRVLQEGEVCAGDEIQPVLADPRGINITQMNSLMYFDKDNRDEISRALQIEALSPGWRTSFEERLAKSTIDSQAEDTYVKLVVTRKVIESENITSFYLASTDNKPLPEFVPGQFLPLRLDIPGQYKPIFRTYSLSDRPSQDYLRISVKREPAPEDRPDLYPGVASNYLHDHADVGTELLAKSPRGKFVLDINASTPVVLLSGGVGQTPMISMLNEIVASGSQRKTLFIHGSRDGRRQAFGTHVRTIEKNEPYVDVHIRYSHPLEEDIAGKDYQDVGHVDLELVKRLSPQDADFFVCGPPAFMDSLLAGLREWGIEAHRIHYEFFGPKSAKHREVVSSKKQMETITECCDEQEVFFSKSEVKTNWNSSCDSLLDLAEANGLTPDYSCRSGICQTCQCRLISGEVEYIEEPIDQPREGMVLICCSRPKSNVVIEI